MSGLNISQRLKKFIKEQIHSVFSLEVLLLFHRNQSRSFTVSEVANELDIELDIAQQQLSELVSTDLLAKTTGVISRYSYDPVDEDVASVVDQLAVAYAKQRVPILSLILSKQPDRIRVFREAFRVIE